jgi:citrate lyase subunit beta/citryl-CoA lyase
MIFNDLEPIKALGKDYEALRALHPKQKRQQNPRQRFKAPLMVSAHQLKHLNKIDTLFCDAVVINLEDGVAPELKELALHYAMLFISHLQSSDKKIIVRVNPLDEGGKEEIKALNGVLPDAIRVPKIEHVEEVELLESLIAKEIDIHLSIETALSWKNLAQLATTSRVTHFYLGILDLLADLGLSQAIIKHDNPTLHYLLGHFLVTSRSVGVEPVSFVFQEHKNMQAFQAWIEMEKEMGFHAKGVISPDQAKAMMQLGADDDEIKRAEHIVRSFEAQQAQGVTGFVDEAYGFIDEPIYKGAKVILQNAKQQ